MRKVLLAVVAIILVIGIVMAVRVLGERNETDAVDAKDAKSIVGSKDSDGDDSKADPGLRPEPGTYTYTGAGREEVDVLGGSEHVFPDTVPVVLELKGDSKSCEWTWNLVYVKQHIEERTYCTTDEGVVDRGYKRDVEFFGKTQTALYECKDDAVRYQTDAKPGTKLEWACRDADSKSDSAYVVTVVGPETLTIDGEEIETQHTKVNAKQTGGTVGTLVGEFWLAPSGLPVRFSEQLDVKTKSVLGETRFQVRAKYELASLDPE